MNTDATPASVVLENSQSYRLEFHWVGDRFEHQLTAEGGNAKTLCKGVQSSWPTSPPLQQLSKESINGQDVVLGVGCAGTSHWSVSVEPIEGGFRFDWACKTKEPPKFLGSRYSTQGKMSVVAGEHGVSTFGDDNAEAEIVPKEELGEAKTYRWSYRIAVTAIGAQASG